MTGGFQMTGTRLALFSSCSLLIVGLAMPAQAADFGGECCADLEERIAELEATTARKGNRKVSLEVSGQVNEAIMFWDDGFESNAYVVGNDTGRSRFRFKGKAKISSDWEAGYRLEVGVRSSRSDRVNQNTDVASELDLRHSSWYLKSNTWGSVTVGQTEGSAEGVTEMNIAQTGDIARNSDPEDHVAGFLLRAQGGGLSAIQWRRLVKENFLQPGDGSRGQYVHYVSPEFAGFTLHAAWGQDDYWDTGIQYSGELGDFALKAEAAYGESRDEDGDGLNCIADDPQARCRQFGGSVAAMHKPTGLFAAFGAGWYEDETIDAMSFDGESTYYSIQAGIEQKWNSLGKTTFYGEYFNFAGGYNDRTVAVNDAINSFGAAAQINSSEVQVYGGGVIQGIEAAEMAVYIFYRHYEADVMLRNGAAVQSSAPLEDFATVVTGAIIDF